MQTFLIFLAVNLLIWWIFDNLLKDKFHALQQASEWKRHNAMEKIALWCIISFIAANLITYVALF
jgi:uncharacterized membrane protein YdjX (TVP38/TMEM64 family)